MTDQYYFDHAASAPRRDEVADAMQRWQHGVVGNPSGSHRAAREARRAVEEARDEIAVFVGAKPGGVIFTAGGTESCHLAVTGVANYHRRHHDLTSIVISPIEHQAVIDAVEMMARDHESISARYVEVDGDGVVDLDSLASMIDEHTAIVSVMAANNETGVVQPLDGIASVVKASLAQGALTHTDAVAAAPWLDLAEVSSSIDMISICAHKIGGPVNSGALILRGEASLDAMVPGGGQERGRRGGTVDVAAAVGLAAAVRLTAKERDEVNQRVADFQRQLVVAFTSLEGCRVTAPDATRLPGTVHLTFEGLASDELIFLLDQAGVCAAAASSCSSGAAVASHVLAAMGMDPQRARGSLRLSMGTETTQGDIDAVIAILTSVAERLYGEL